MPPTGFESIFNGGARDAEVPAPFTETHRLAVRRVAAVRLELLCPCHLGEAALLVTASAARHQIIWPVVIGSVVEVIDMHVIPSHLG